MFFLILSLFLLGFFVLCLHLLLGACLVSLSSLDGDSCASEAAVKETATLHQQIFKEFSHWGWEDDL